jgi:hypothetical protein
MAELGVSGSGGEKPDPAMSGPEDTGEGNLENTSGARQDTSRSGTSEAGGSRGSGSEPGPAETLTRERYAGEMRDGPSVGHDGSAEHDRAAEHESEPARADANTAADGALAEPRSRQEVADEARDGTDAVTSSAEPLRERSDGHDHPDHWFSIASAERTVGDTTPTGIGLKLASEEHDLEPGQTSTASEAHDRLVGRGGPSSSLEHDTVYVDGRDVEATHNPADGIWFEGMGEIPDAPVGDPYGTGRAGEVVASPDEMKMSRLERLNRVVCERLDGIADEIDRDAVTIQDLHYKDPPRPPSPTFKGTADRTSQISPLTADHGVDFGHGLEAALVAGAVGAKMGHWIHEKWQQRARDRRHGSD